MYVGFDSTYGVSMSTWIISWYCWSPSAANFVTPETFIPLKSCQLTCLRRGVRFHGTLLCGSVRGAHAVMKLSHHWSDVPMGGLSVEQWRVVVPSPFSVRAAWTKLWRELLALWINSRSPARLFGLRVCRQRRSGLGSTSTMDEDNNLLPDLKDIETKMGRKVPDSLIRSLVAGKHHEKHEGSAAPQSVSCKLRSGSADLKRLESKMQLLKQEMVRTPFLEPVAGENEDGTGSSD